ncbi:STX18 protein, partial [Amia calva]|nr:STX18 protein [Amia calva]
MAVDITLLFKASVKTVKTRNKAIGVGFDTSKDELFKKSRPKSDFSNRAKDVISNITKLKDFLLQHRKDYVNAGSKKKKVSVKMCGDLKIQHTRIHYLTMQKLNKKTKENVLVSSDYTRMTDNERDQIDQDAQTFMRTCSDAIKYLRSEADKKVISAQVKEHRGAVLDLIEVYLRGVCKLYSEQRAIRVKRVVDKKRLCWVSSLVMLCQACTAAVFSSCLFLDKNVTEVQESNFGPWEDDKVEDELSPEEIQMFEQENQRLVSEMNSLVDEVRQIEGKVVEISRLQEIFAEKVLHQEAEIDNIHQLVVGTTENVKEGNEDIREAIKNNAGFRVWILFFLVMCSFSLLFLDWYDS